LRKTVRKFNEFLFTDDNHVSNPVSRRVAERLGVFSRHYIVHQVQDAWTTRQRAKGTAKAPNLILLDLHMPVMDGFYFLQAFHQLTFPDKKNSAVMVLTASEKPEDVKRAHGMGISDYVFKSLGLKDLQMAMFSSHQKALKRSWQDLKNNQLRTDK
jgi:CheY-like chemotaxis protein